MNKKVQTSNIHIPGEIVAEIMFFFLETDCFVSYDDDRYPPGSEKKFFIRTMFQVCSHWRRSLFENPAVMKKIAFTPDTKCDLNTIGKYAHSIWIKDRLRQWSNGQMETLRELIGHRRLELLAFEGGSHEDLNDTHPFVSLSVSKVLCNDIQSCELFTTNVDILKRFNPEALDFSCTHYELVDVLSTGPKFSNLRSMAFEFTTGMFIKASNYYTSPDDDLLTLIFKSCPKLEYLHLNTASDYQGIMRREMLDVTALVECNNHPLRSLFLGDGFTHLLSLKENTSDTNERHRSNYNLKRLSITMGSHDQDTLTTLLSCCKGIINLEIRNSSDSVFLSSRFILSLPRRCELELYGGLVDAGNFSPDKIVVMNKLFDKNHLTLDEDRKSVETALRRMGLYNMGKCITRQQSTYEKVVSIFENYKKIQEEVLKQCRNEDERSLVKSYGSNLYSNNGIRLYICHDLYSYYLSFGLDWKKLAPHERRIVIEYKDHKKSEFVRFCIAPEKVQERINN